MRIKFVQEIIDKARGKVVVDETEKDPLYHKYYGKIYFPYYNNAFKIDSRGHEIYNQDGQKMETFFIRDIHFAHSPYQESKYFVWDRYNIGLNTHFYSHNTMLETMGNPTYKYGMFVESKAIVPEDYKIFEKYSGLNKDFDLIFTYDTDILEKYDNARFVPFCARIWNENLIIQNSYLKKTKNVSILSSDKLMCDLHKYRLDLAMKCKSQHLADTYGTFDGGNYVNLTDTLNDYRYTICIENDVTPYFFTERVVTALACGVVPIYLGAEKIDEFFNPDGIIKITTNDDIEKVLSQCTPEEYVRRLPAIIDNIERAKKYRNPMDYMAEEYLFKR